MEATANIIATYALRFLKISIATIHFVGVLKLERFQTAEA